MDHVEGVYWSTIPTAMIGSLWLGIGMNNFNREILDLDEITALLALLGPYQVR